MAVAHALITNERGRLETYAGPHEDTGVAAADNAVAFGLLGPLLVTVRDGRPIRIPATKQRIILAALLLRANMTVSAEQIADAVWGTSPPPNAISVIRTYVARLRRILGQASTRLVSRPTGYAIVVHQPGEFDLAELERFRIETQQVAETGQWDRAAFLSAKALSLWRGVPLEDVPSATLHLADAERLDELRLQFATARMDAELHLGREQYVLAELLKLASENPLREHIQAQLMLAYYRCGRQAEALALYRKVHTSLADELGVVPGPELCQLHQEILARRSSPRLAQRFPAQ